MRVLRILATVCCTFMIVSCGASSSPTADAAAPVETAPTVASEAEATPAEEAAPVEAAPSEPVVPEPVVPVVPPPAVTPVCTIIDDGDACTIDACVNGAAVHTAVVVDDGDTCTVDTCVNGAAAHTAVVVDDGDTCTVDSCVNGAAVHTALAVDDGDACTVDTCANGAAVHTAIAVDDGNSCTIDSCASGVAQHVAAADGTSCSDGNSCTVDACRAGSCVGVADCSTLSAVWANDGGDKVTQAELRASANPASVVNTVWPGVSPATEVIRAFGARNEVVGFTVVLEAATAAVPNVSVEFDQLAGPNGATIRSAPTTGNGVFSWVGRNIELFFVRYLQIKGLSYFGYPTYDERLIPERLQRPWTMNAHIAQGQGGWADRPDHDAFYPDIAVPLELVPTFTVASGTNQSIWADIYIPKTAPAGVYRGVVSIREAGVVTKQVPVELTVRNFTLPDTPSAKTMIALGYGDINERYLGLANRFPNGGSAEDAASDQIIDRHFQLAHRHKLSLIDANFGGEVWTVDAPRPEWEPRLDGTLFSAANGYDGPGVGTPNDVFSIGTYHSWFGSNWDEESEMRTHSDNWVNWFTANAPATDYFLYLIDESSDLAQTDTWAQWLRNNPGPGRALQSLATLPLTSAVASAPNVTLPTATMGVGETAPWNAAWQTLQDDPARAPWMYNGQRPAAGTFVTDDDGVALRVTAWAQYKKRIPRWFYWESTYYYDPQTCGDRVDVFATAKTIGCVAGVDAGRGEYGYLYTNGDGVLFYPGTDTIYPANSYNLEGPIASLRLKHWRRGIQDVDYLTLAAQKNPAAVDALVQRMIPKVLWEYGVHNPSDPTYVHTAVSWSTDPDLWEAARAELAAIIEGP